MDDTGCLAAGREHHVLAGTFGAGARLDPPTLTLWLWPGWRFWTLDGDRGIPEERLATLSSVSGVPEEALRAATILPIASRLQGEHLNTTSSWPWTLTIGARNMRRNGGIQFCPACLQEDDTPYFRLPWRGVRDVYGRPEGRRNGTLSA